MPKGKRKKQKVAEETSEEFYLPIDDLIRLLMTRSMALETLLISKGIITPEEFEYVLEEMASSVDEVLEQSEEVPVEKVKPPGNSDLN